MKSNLIHLSHKSWYELKLGAWCLSQYWPRSMVSYGIIRTQWVNTLRPRQNGRHFADIFKCNFLDETVWISIKILLKFLPTGPINNISALVQIMAWHRLGDKPLSEPKWLVYWRIYASLGLNELMLALLSDLPLMNCSSFRSCKTPHHSL